MVKTVAFIDVVHVIPERPEKPVSAWTKNLAATSRVTTNLFNRVRPTSAGASLTQGGDDAAALGRFVVSQQESDAAAASAATAGAAAAAAAATTAAATSTTQQVGPAPHLERSHSQPGVATLGSQAKDTNGHGAEEVLASAARDLHARAKKFQKAIPRLGPRWAAPFLSSGNNSNSSSSNAAGDAQPADLNAAGAGNHGAPISPPMTPEQSLLASGAPTANKFFANALQSHGLGHSHSASLPLVSYPVTPPQHDVPHLGLTHPSAIDRAFSAQDVNQINTNNSNQRKALVKSCLKPPSSMFYAELSVFVRIHQGSPDEDVGDAPPGMPIDVADTTLTGSAAAESVAQAPMIRGMTTERPWHRTDGPPVLSRLTASGLVGTGRSPEHELANPDSSLSSIPASASAPAAPGVTLVMPVPRPAQHLHVPFAEPQRSHSPGTQNSDGGHHPQRTMNPSLSAGSPPTPLGESQTSFSDSQGLHIQLKAECACKGCTERILHGLSPSYTPSWTQIARNKYLADRAQERKVREQGMDAEVRLALRGMQEATMKWLEGRDIEEITDAELAQLNADDLVSGLLDVHLEEEEEEEEAERQHQQQQQQQMQDVNAMQQVLAQLDLPPRLPGKPSASSLRNATLSPSVSTRNSSTSLKPSFASQNTLEPGPLHQWPSQNPETSSASSSGSCTPVGSGSVRLASRLEYRRSSVTHSRTASVEFPPPSPSAAASAMLSTNGVSGLTTSADEDPELKAALATPPLSRRTSFGSSTFRALNRRASLESLRVAKRRHSRTSLQPQEEDDNDTEVEDKDSDDDDDYGSAEASSVVVLEQPNVGPLLSVLNASPRNSLPTTSAPPPPRVEASTVSLQHWALQLDPSTAVLPATDIKESKSDKLKRSIPSGSSDEDEEQISTPVASDFITSGETTLDASSVHRHAANRADGSNDALKRASWAPDFVMRNLIRERQQHQRAGSDVGADAQAAAAVLRAQNGNGGDGGAAVPPVPWAWDRRPSDGQVSDASVYFDARQSSNGHSSASRPLSLAGPGPGPLEGLRISPINGGVTGAQAAAAASAAQALTQAQAPELASASAAQTPSTSREQSPEIPKKTLADRRSRPSTDDKAPLTIDPSPAAARTARSGRKSAPSIPADEDAASSSQHSTGRGSKPRTIDSKAAGSDAGCSSRPSSFYLGGSSTTVYPASIAQVVRPSGSADTSTTTATSVQRGIGLAASEAGWSVESLPIPPSVGHSRSNSASVSAENLHNKPFAGFARYQIGADADGGDELTEELCSPIARAPPQSPVFKTKSGPGTSRAGSPESTRSGGVGNGHGHGAGNGNGNGIGLGKRVKDLFANPRRSSRGLFLANGLASPVGFGSSSGHGSSSAVASKTGDAESPASDAEAEPPLPSPATPSTGRFRALVRRGRQSTADLVLNASKANAFGADGSSAGSTPSTPLTGTLPSLESGSGASADGFVPMSKVSSAEAFAGFPKLGARHVSGPAVPTLASSAKDKESRESGGGWKPKLSRNLSTDAIKGALSGVTGSGGGGKENARSSSSSSNGHNANHGLPFSASHSNGGADNKPVQNGGNKKSSSSFAGAFLATLSQTGGGVGGVPLPGGGAGMYRPSRASKNSSSGTSKRDSQWGRPRPGTSEGLNGASALSGSGGGGGGGNLPRSRSGERYQHRPVQSQGTLY
ncbi:hypothetical protein OC834_006020 [Tilletia horrida]|nr:hypothetical protein OC834_006020 [Tilletia horrida]